RLAVGQRGVDDLAVQCQPAVREYFMTTRADAPALHVQGASNEVRVAQDQPGVGPAVPRPKLAPVALGQPSRGGDVPLDRARGLSRRAARRTVFPPPATLLRSFLFLCQSRTSKRAASSWRRKLVLIPGPFRTVQPHATATRSCRNGASPACLG